MNSTPMILICDDDPVVHQSLSLYLDAEGFAHASAFDGEEALRLAEAATPPDLLLLDLMMPRLGGLEVCAKLRQTSRVPVIMLSARGEEVDRIVGLELGADDYIVKPFSAREVVARVKAVLRRFTAAKEEPEKVLRFPGLEINISNYDVRIQGEPVQFTPKEVEILYLLASKPGRVFDREQMLSQVWGYDFFGDTRAVDTQIKRIRQKLPQEGVNWGIRTVYGVGYKFECGE